VYLEAVLADTSSGLQALAYSVPSKTSPRALVALYPAGPRWAGYLLLTTCEGRVLDSLETGGIDSIRFRSITGRPRPEALVFALSGSGTGALTYTAFLLALRSDSLQLLWARPYLDYFISADGGGRDSGSITFPRLARLVYEGASRPFRLDSLTDSIVPEAPPCVFRESWRWRQSVDSFEFVSGASVASCHQRFGLRR
jgi:hypothetical protein